MKDSMTKGREELIGALYVKYAPEVRAYFNVCLHDAMESEDMTHDLFLKLFNIDILSDTTAKSLIFVMAKRMVVDHMRRKKNNQTFMQYYYDIHSSRTSSSSNAIVMLGTYEQGGLMIMTRRRAQVYLMYFREGKSVSEISVMLNMKRRTVESHIYMSRQIMQRHLRSVV
ncbi:MAG: RNA polymerase sigma factor [Prevotella sp.]